MVMSPELLTMHDGKDANFKWLQLSIGRKKNEFINDVGEEIMSKECGGKLKCPPSVSDAEKGDGAITGEVKKKERKKMKLFSRGRTVPFIPGFRKSKKVNNLYNEKITRKDDPLSNNHEVGEVLKPHKIGADTTLNSGENESFVRSVCTYDFSSTKEPLADQRTTSIDSGIDCLHPSLLSSDKVQKMSDYVSLPVGPTIIKPQPTSDLPGQSANSVRVPSLDDITTCNSSSSSDVHCVDQHFKCIDQSSTKENSGGCVSENAEGRAPGNPEGCVPENAGGRAPIASPEDDSLLCPPTDSEDSELTDTDSVYLSPEKSVVPRNSLDTDSDSDLLSPKKPCVEFKTRSVKDSSTFYSSCDSDSDSDSEQNLQNFNNDSSDSDTSDSYDSQGSMFFIQKKCYNESVPQSQAQFKSTSRLDTKYVNNTCVNSKCTVKSSHVKPNRRKETTFGVTPDKSKTVVLDSPHMLVNPLPTYARNNSSTSTMFCQRGASSELKVNDTSAFSNFNSSGSFRNKISYIDSTKPVVKSQPVGKTKKGFMSSLSKVRLKRSVSDSGGRHRFSFKSAQNRDIETSVCDKDKSNFVSSAFKNLSLSALSSKNTSFTSMSSSNKGVDRSLSSSKSLNFSTSSSSALDKNSSLSLSKNSSLSSLPKNSSLSSLPKNSSLSSLSKNSSPTLNLDTSKSPQDVQRAMKKTAFWVENNCYDHTLDPSSTNSLLKEKKRVSETDLCNEILGIYFGDDSDSSLSSSCLDNTGDSSSSLSCVSDENLDPRDSDDLTVATFVPAPCFTSEAKTRRIRKDFQCEVGRPVAVQMEGNRTQQKVILQERTCNSTSTKSNKNKTVPVKKKIQGTPKSEKKPPSVLSEHDVDTITKLHTICNGQRKVKYLNLSESPMIIKHFPPPKNASRISWCEKLADSDLIHHTPSNTPAKVVKPILYERPKTDMFPFDEDKPSPIVITKLRRSKSTSRRREWPW